jgi:hypothetical protein
MLSEATEEEIRIYGNKNHQGAVSGLIVDLKNLYLTEAEKKILLMKDNNNWLIASYCGGRFIVRAVRDTDNLMRMPEYDSIRRNPKMNLQIHNGAEFKVQYKNALFLHAFFLSDNNIHDGYQFRVSYDYDQHMVIYDRVDVNCGKCGKSVPATESIFISAMKLKPAVKPVAPAAKHADSIVTEMFDVKYEVRLDGKKEDKKTSSFSFSDGIFHEDMMENYLRTIISESKKNLGRCALRFGKKKGVSGNNKEEILIAYKNALDADHKAEGTKTSYIRELKDYLDYLAA